MSIRLPERRARLLLLGLLTLGLLACGAGSATPGRSGQASPTPPGGAGNPYALLADLQREPAAALQLPGSTELARNGQEREVFRFRPRGAIIGSSFGTTEGQDAVFAYYDRELRALGYTDATIGFLPSQNELALRGWCRPGTAVVRLAVIDQSIDYLPKDVRDGRYRTVFSVSIDGLQPTDTCPNP